jgi:DNA invertase Pin-like site-specific DNA recombinase
MIHGYMISSSDAKKVAAQLKDAGCDNVHRDTRGAKSERAQRKRAIEQLGSGDTIVVARLNQIADSTLDLLRTLTDISDRKALFRSLAEPWADTKASGTIRLLTVLEGIAAFERDVRSARTEAGQARAVARGVKLGRKPKLTPKQEQEALRRRKKGETLATIAETYNVSHSTISRLVA